LANNKKKKGLASNKLRAAVFLCIIAAIVIAFNHFMGFAGADRTNTVLKQFYDQEDNTIDSVFFGSSVTQRGFVSPVAYNDHGVASYSIATGSQPFILTRYMMEDVLRSQDPEIFIIDLKNICRGKDKLEDSAVRKIIDNMEYSRTKIDAIKAVTEYAEGGENDIDTSGASYYFPILKYHNRWNPDLQPEYWDDLYYFKGYTLAASVCFGVQKIHPPEFSKDLKKPLDEENEELLKDLLDYCDTLDQKVLFVVAPYEATKTGMGKLNTATEIIGSRGYTVLNFLSEDLREEAGIDVKTCFHNKQHLNYYGSLKYTDYISRYIKEHYGITDRRGDPTRDSWAASYDDLQDLIKTKYSDLYNEMYATIEKTESGEN
jgi:hypothetical protein